MLTTLRLLLRCGVAIALALLALQVSAGTLREWLTQRRAAMQQNALEEGGEQPARIALPSGVQLLHNVGYGSDRLQAMDVYLPAHASNAPIIVMVHGGGWRQGDKAMRSVTENKVERWLPRGFIFVSVNNRLLPSADPLQQAGDVARALTIVQGKAAAWGGDPARVVLMGHSSGAHLVALLAANPILARQQGARPWLGTVALDSAALNVEEVMQDAHHRLYDSAFGQDRAFWRAASPTLTLSSGAAPVLMVCSARRVDGSCRQAHAFALKAAALGIRAMVLEQDLSHRQINDTLGLPGPYTDTVEEFMRSLDADMARRLESG